MDRLNRSTGNESTQVKPAEGTQKEPVAIIGLSCRFPGAADQNAFALLVSGGNAISEVPDDRWDVDAYYNPCSDVPGTITSRWGGFLKDVDQFDAAFFGISPREAQELYPNSECYLNRPDAPEDAGIDPHRLAGSRTGVFVGISTSDYAHLLLRQGDEAIGPYLGIGNAHSAAAGRISYVLGLEGPSLAIDTACSSSLVAVYQASCLLNAGVPTRHRRGRQPAIGTSTEYLLQQGAIPG